MRLTFIRSSIKIITDMRTVHAKNTVTFITPVTDDGTCKPEHGWLNVDGKIHCITDIHTFDDFGVEHETLTLDDGSEYFTQDGGETFHEN